MLTKHRLLSSCARRSLQNSGFGLVEIMVGMVIGLMSTLAIMQVVSAFEERKRNTTGGADAQTNGSMALYNIKRDVEMAGYGTPVFSHANSPLLCATQPTFDHDADAGTPAIDLFPIVITDGGAGSDRIAIRYGRTDSGGIPLRIRSATGVNPVFVDNNAACQADDWAIIVMGSSTPNSATCTMTQVDSTLAPLATRPSFLTIPLTGTPTVNPGDSIACIGTYKKDPPFDDHSSPLEYLYWVDDGELVQGGNPAVAGSGAPIFSGIVSIQAQYGISAAANSNQITQWVDATGGWVTPTTANRNRIKAIRIALIARNNGALEKTSVTTACSSTTAADPTGLCAWDATSAAPVVPSPAPTVDLSADADWQRYRYRVFETIIPLRSMIWSSRSFPSS